MCQPIGTRAPSFVNPPWIFVWYAALAHSLDYYKAGCHCHGFIVWLFSPALTKCLNVFFAHVWIHDCKYALLLLVSIPCFMNHTNALVTLRLIKQCDWMHDSNTGYVCHGMGQQTHSNIFGTSEFRFVSHQHEFCTSLYTLQLLIHL